jgi:uncharacterized linocin/CFP29 family protein
MANMDIISNGKAIGEVANFLATRGRLDIGAMRPFIGRDGRAYVSVYSGGDPTKPESYRTIQTNAATLRRDEWKQLDDAVLMAVQSRLTGIQDLIDNGLVFNLGNPMGTTMLEWHDVSDAMEADITMDGVARSKGDRPVYQTNYLPIPIVHVDYEINLRVLEASRRLGNPMDTVSAERAARKVAEKLEGLLFTNTEYHFGEKDDRLRNAIYSYLSHPDNNDVTMDLEWDDSSASGSTVIDDVLAMKQALIDKGFYNSYMVYVPTAYETVLDMDYNVDAPGKTIRQRILDIGGIRDVKVADKLPANTVVMVQMTTDVVRLVNGLAIQNVEWETEGRFITKHKVLAIQVPQIRSDSNGNCGVAVLAKS